MNYYWISINNRKVSSIAYAPEGTPVAHELIHDVVGKSMLPFPLELHSATDKDYLGIGGVGLTPAGERPSRTSTIRA